MSYSDGAAETDEEIIENRSSSERSYLRSLKSIVQGFSRFFRLIAVVYALVALVSIFGTLLLMSRIEDGSGALGLLTMLFTIFNICLAVWFAGLCASLANLHIKKIEDDVRYRLVFDKETRGMTADILDKVRKRAEQISQTLTVYGNFVGNQTAVVGNDNEITQTVQKADRDEVASALGLLIAYCEESGRQDAQELARKIAGEAEKPTPDRNIIFDAWTRLVSIIPTVGTVVGIINGIRTLMGT
ncbi:hypothetical protein AB9F43_28805 [Rhizobium leguminosarum]|uniref:hypothetical protein n=1 Tax=Rhizobium leguminosarum TaxID=384 RepID=UPI003F987FA3